MRITKRGRRRLIVLIGAVILTCASILIVDATRSAQQHRLLNKARSDGLAAYQAGDLTTTLNELSYVFEHDKDDLEVNLAFADARIRQPTASSRHLWEAVDLYTNHCLRLLNAHPVPEGGQSHRRHVYERLLAAYSQLGMTFEVLETANRLLGIDADCLDCLAAKAEALCLQGQFHEALPVAQRLLELEPHSLTWARLNLDIQGRVGATLEQRLEQCRQWAADFQDDGRFHVLLAALLLDADRAADVNAELEKATALGATNEDVLSACLELLDLLDQWDRSDALVAATLEKFPTEPWVHEASVRRLWQSNRLDEALAALERARREANAFTPGLHRLRVLTLLCHGQIDEAKSALREFQHASMGLNEADRAWADAVMLALESEGLQWQARMESLRRALALSNQDPALYSLMGDAWSDAGESAQAVFFYRRAFELAPSWIAAGLVYTDALLHAGRFEEAHWVSRIVVSRAPKTQLDPFLGYARAYLSLRRTGRAVELPDWDDAVGAELIPLLREAFAAPDAPRRAFIGRLLAEAIFQYEGAPAAAEFIAGQLEQGSLTVNESVALLESALQNDLPLPEAILDSIAAPSADSLPLAWCAAEICAQRGDPAAGLEIIDAVAVRDVQVAAERAAFMMRHDLPNWRDEVATLLAERPDSIVIPQMVAAHPSAWKDADLIKTVVENLRRNLGDDSPQVRLAQAGILLRQNPLEDARLARAIIDIERVLEQSPDSLAALALMADAMMRTTPPNIDRAVSCLERGAALYSGETSLITRLIPLLQQRGDYARAGRYLTFLARRDEGDTRLRRIELHLWQNQPDFDSALARAAAIVNDESRPSDQLILASIQQRAGRRRDAEAIYERLLQSPDNRRDPMIVSQAAEFYAASGRFDDGLDLMTSIEAAAGSLNRDLLIGSFCQRHGRFDLARTHLERALRAQPASPEVRAELAWHLLSQGEHAQAARHALEGFKSSPDNARLRAGLASAMVRADQAVRRQALEYLQSANGANDDLVAMLSLLQQLPVRDGKAVPSPANLAAARRLVEDEREPASRLLPAWQMAIQLHLDAGRLDEAMGLARRAVSRFPGQPQPSQWATEMLATARQWREALAEAQEWRRRSFDEAAGPIRADLAISTILLELDRADDALNQIQPYAPQFRDEARVFPDRLAVLLRALALSSDESNWRQARDIAAPLLPIDAYWRDAWLRIASEIIDRRAAEALALLEDSVVDAAEFLTLAAHWTALGKMTAEAPYFDRAESLAARARQEARLTIPALIAQGSIAEARKDWRGAEEFYREALVNESANALALNNLAFVLVQIDRAAESLPLIEQAMRRTPDQPDFLDTHGRVLLALQRFEEAERQFKRAADLRPDDLGIAVSLAESLLRQGDVRYAALAQAMTDLRQRIRLNKRTDPDVAARFQDLWQQFQQTQAAALP